MSNSFYYVDGGATTHHWFTAGSAGCQYLALRNTERWTPNREDFVEGTPNRMANQYRSSTWKEATYEVQLLLKGTSGASLEALKGNWETWHDSELGEGFVRRITQSGNTRCLDCLPALPSIEPDGESPVSAIVTQRYIAAFPWWRDNAQSTAGSAFTGSTSVNVTCGNTGDIASYPVFVITGIVNKPRVTISTDTFQVNGTSGAGTTITVDMRPQSANRMSVYKQTGGTGAKTYLTITSASKYLTLPKGTSGVGLDATSGNATVVISWYNYHRSMF